MKIHFSSDFNRCWRVCDYFVAVVRDFLFYPIFESVAYSAEHSPSSTASQAPKIKRAVSTIWRFNAFSCLFIFILFGVTFGPFYLLVFSLLFGIWLCVLYTCVSTFFACISFICINSNDLLSVLNMCNSCCCICMTNLLTEILLPLSLAFLLRFMSLLIRRTNIILHSFQYEREIL